MSAQDSILIGCFPRQRWGWTARRRLLPEVEEMCNVGSALRQLFAYVTQHGTVRPVSPATGLRNQLTNATKSG